MASTELGRAQGSETTGRHTGPRAGPIALTVPPPGSITWTVESHSKIAREPSADGDADDPLVLHADGLVVRLDDGEELLPWGEQTGAVLEPMETRLHTVRRRS